MGPRVLFSTAVLLCDASFGKADVQSGLGNRRKLKDVHMPGLTAGKDWDTEIQQWQRKMQEWQADAKKHHWSPTPAPTSKAPKTHKPPKTTKAPKTHKPPKTTKAPKTHKPPKTKPPKTHKPPRTHKPKPPPPSCPPHHYWNSHKGCCPSGPPPPPPSCGHCGPGSGHNPHNPWWYYNPWSPPRGGGGWGGGWGQGSPAQQFQQFIWSFISQYLPSILGSWSSGGGGGWSFSGNSGGGGSSTSWSTHSSGGNRNSWGHSSSQPLSHKPASYGSWPTLSLASGSAPSKQWSARCTVGTVCAATCRCWCAASQALVPVAPVVVTDCVGPTTQALISWQFGPQQLLAPIPRRSPGCLAAHHLAQLKVVTLLAHPPAHNLALQCLPLVMPPQNTRSLLVHSSTLL